MRKIYLNKLIEGLRPEENFVFLETARLDKDNRYSYLFKNPLDIIHCYSSDRVFDSLDKIERMVHKGLFAAGFISYEAGFAFEDAIKQKKNSDFPLMWFGIFEKPVVFDHRNTIFVCDEQGGHYSLDSIKQNISKKRYIDSVNKIKRYIEGGYTYQVNYTFKLDFSFNGNPCNLYCDLKNKQRVSYSAIIRFGNRQILSFSPELFLKKKNGLLQVKPMKGTQARGRFLKEDRENASALYNCLKNRSENLMILDLLRNDLGKISRTNTVSAKRFFEVEKYESLFQMTSTIESQVSKNLSLQDLFKAVFPSGSVTGAPKIRTMQIIDDLEKSPRKIYTGSMGFISPNKDCVFNVAIRTLLMDSETGKGEMGIGSGIVYDSDAEKEYEECLLKSKFLTEKPKNVSLIETMLWHPARGFELLEFHLQRLKESSEYFDYKYDKGKFTTYLNNLQAGFGKNKKLRVRLLLNRQGDITADYSILHDSNVPKIVTLSHFRTNSFDKWFYHKTTNRDLYDSEYKKYKKTGFFDVVFQNEKGQITEGSISNIFIKRNGIYYTPPIECGVLNGVYRRYIFSSGKLKVREGILYPEDLFKAESIFISNAVRGMSSVRLYKNPLLLQKVKPDKAASLKKEYAYA